MINQHSMEVMSDGHRRTCTRVPAIWLAQECMNLHLDNLWSVPSDFYCYLQERIRLEMGDDGKFFTLKILKIIIITMNKNSI